MRKPDKMYYNLEQIKLMSKGTFFDPSHTKHDIQVSAWMDHVIILNNENKLRVYKFVPAGRVQFENVALPENVHTVGQAQKFIEKKESELKPISDAQIESIVVEGVNEMYGMIQKKIGVETGDNAGLYHSGSDIEKILFDFFKKYVEFERRQTEV